MLKTHKITLPYTKTRFENDVINRYVCELHKSQNEVYINIGYCYQVGI